MRVTPLHGAGVAWYKCPACRLRCRPTAVSPDGSCPRCGHSHMMRLSFGGPPTASTPDGDERS